MCPRGNPGEEYEALKGLAAPLGALLAESYTSQPDPDEGDQRHYEGVNPVDPLPYNSSTSQSDPDHGDQRLYEGVNTHFLPVDSLLDDSFTFELDPDQGDQRHYEGVNPVDTLLYNSSTSQLNPDYEDQRQRIHEFVQTLPRPVVDPLISNSLFPSELDPDQGDQRPHECVNLVDASLYNSFISQSDTDQDDELFNADIDSLFPPVESLPYNASTFELDPDHKCYSRATKRRKI